MSIQARKLVPHPGYRNLVNYILERDVLGVRKEAETMLLMNREGQMAGKGGVPPPRATVEEVQQAGNSEGLSTTWKDNRRLVYQAFEILQEWPEGLLALTPSKEAAHRHPEANMFRTFIKDFFEWQEGLIPNNHARLKEQVDSGKLEETLLMLARCKESPAGEPWVAEIVFNRWMHMVLAYDMGRPSPSLLEALNVSEYFRSVDRKMGQGEEETYLNHMMESAFLGALKEEKKFKQHFCWLREVFGKGVPWILELEEQEVKALMAFPQSEEEARMETGFTQAYRRWDNFMKASQARQEEKKLQGRLQEGSREKASRNRKL